MKISPPLYLLLVLIVPTLVWIVPVHAQTVATGVDAGNILTLILGLGFVLLLIVGCAWLVKRMTGLQGTRAGKIKVIAVLPVGGRERIALIEVAGKQLVVGVTASQITLLHSFDEAVVDTPVETQQSDFAQKLHRMLSNR